MNYVVEKDLPVRTRDGICLATDVHRPLDAGPLPVLLLRTPYDKERMLAVTSSQADIPRFVRAGYAVVVQDVRGRFGSQGDFVPLSPCETTDGEDTIAWAASQSWSSGRIGMFGASYQSTTQLLAAFGAPPALGAMALSIAPADPYETLVYPGGAFSLGVQLGWYLGIAQHAIARRVQASARRTQSDALSELDAFRASCEVLPLADQPLLQEALPSYTFWLEHPTRDAYWQALAPSARYAHVAAPALHVGGWFDVFLRGTLANYAGLKAAGHVPQRLVIGPWAHTNFFGAFPEQDYGLRAHAEVGDLTGQLVRWFDHWLKNADNGVGDEPQVRLFVMGVNQWRDEAAWPLADTRFTDYYLHSGGRANTLGGDGWLSVDPPGVEPDDRYLADPRQPVPSVGGPTLMPGGGYPVAGPSDQRAVEARADVLCYTTPTREQPLEVTGPVELTLFASSSGRDTDFCAKLLDVFPDGRALLLTDGILRARYRESFASPLPLEPGTVYPLHLDLGATSLVFQPGHRVRLEIASSNFPRFDRNPQTGETIATELLDRFVPALNRVYHSADHASHLRLPIVERSFLQL